MDLIVFDLDGTLLDGKSKVSDHTRETLCRLRDRNIAYTVATGRTLHAARDLLDGHGFTLPHIFKNGVMTWRPEHDAFSHCSLLTLPEVGAILESFAEVDVSPFIFTLEGETDHTVYHPELRSDTERELLRVFAKERGLKVVPQAALPGDARITNISALGAKSAIEALATRVDDQPHLVAYAGTAIEGKGLHWIDVHHGEASKGGAIAQLKQDLGVSRVICFGDSDNDLSMFAMADEAYAPSNAKAPVLEAATAVIGHHDEDGVSEFLRERFNL